jgi:hypothetical protein
MAWTRDSCCLAVVTHIDKLSGSLKRGSCARSHALPFHLLLLWLLWVIAATVHAILPSARPLHRPRQPQETPFPFVSATAPAEVHARRKPQPAHVATAPRPPHARRQVRSSTLTSGPTLHPAVLVMDNRTLETYPTNYCGFETGNPSRCIKDYSKVSGRSS